MNIMSLNTVQILSLALESDIQAIIDACKLDIALQSAKDTGGTSKAQRVKKALAYIKKIDRPNMAGTFMNGECQCLTNGYTGFMFYDPLPGLPACDFEFDLRKLHNDTNADTIVPDLPFLLSEARRIVAESKATKQQPIITISNRHYNARYLLDIHAILSGNITMSYNNDNISSPAVFESENGLAIIMPIRKG